MKYDDKIEHDDINDDEIRIITNSDDEFDFVPNRSKSPKPKRYRRWVIAAVIIFFLGCLVYGIATIHDNGSWTLKRSDSMNSARSAAHAGRLKRFFNGEVPDYPASYVTDREIEINGVKLMTLYPDNATPSLEIGAKSLADEDIILAVRAADVREDNGEIAGAFVKRGELISKGTAKAGFCSIIDGNLTIGVADATPMFEQALTSGGDFFRQYPLVVGGQVVENKPKGKAIRKALVEIGGRICVVESMERMTYHDFSQTLVEAGVQNAINLSGANSSGFYINPENQKINIGVKPENDFENSSYIVWRKNK